MLNYKDFIHPEDEAARLQMEALPGFQTVTKYFIELGLEKMIHGLFMAEKIRLSPQQIPNVYNMLVPICRKFEIDEPEFYLEMNPQPNAYTTGDKQTFMVVTSGLLQTCNDEELTAVLAHECGHILCRHVFYSTVAHFLVFFVNAMGLLGKLVVPIEYSLNYWSRRSELSADRASVVYAGESAPMTNALLRITGGPKSITGEINVEEYAKQAKHYDELRENSKWHKFLQGVAILERDHPFSAVRISELMKWSNSNEFKQLRQTFIDQENMVRCRRCNNLNHKNNHFCRFCGNPITEG